MKWSIISFKLASLSCACCRSCARSSAGRRSVVCSRAVIGRPPPYSGSPRSCSVRVRSFSWYSFGLLLSFFVFFEPALKNLKNQSIFRVAQLLCLKYQPGIKVVRNSQSGTHSFAHRHLLLFGMGGCPPVAYIIGGCHCVVNSLTCKTLVAIMVSQ